MGFGISDLNMAMIADLVYLDADNDAVKQYYNSGTLNVRDLINYCDTENRFGKFTEEQRENFLEQCGDWKITNVMNDNQSNKCGLYGFVVEPEGGKGIVAFRGSEGFIENLNDWENNCTLLTKIDTLQHEAINKHIKNGIFDNYTELAVTGHSLGGNNANYFTTGTSRLTREDGSLINLQDKITDCRSYNAPGHNSDYIEKNIDIINEKSGIMKNFQNEHDVVSSILHNPTPGIIIQSNDKGEGYMDNHSIYTFKANNDGSLKEKADGEKDYKCKITNELTLYLEEKSKAETGSLVSSVFANINLMIIADKLCKLEKEAYKTNSIYTHGNFIKVLVTIKAIQEVYPKIKNYFTKEDIWCALSIVVSNFSKEIEKKYISPVKDTLCNFLSGLVEFIDTKVNSIRGLNNYCSCNCVADETINIRTEDLAMVIEKLNLIQSRLRRVDQNLNVLGCGEGLADSIKIALIDFKVGQDFNVAKAIGYLNYTLESMNTCERKIMEKAQSFY